MQSEYKGGQLVVKVLEEFGAKVVFGIPGGQTLSVTDAIYDTDIRFIHTRHENGAACAADGWGRLTGQPGICLATTGCGATNLITGLGGALRDSSPVIALIFQNKLPDAGKGDAQESNHEALFSSICKEYIPVRAASNIVWAMREAYRVATTGRPGPVVVDLYRDVVENQTAPYEYADPASYCVKTRTKPYEEDILAAAEEIKQSKKLCIWCGNGVKLADASEEVMELSRVTNAPIVTTYNGIGTIPGSFENLAGPRSRHGSVVTKAVIEEADCIVLIGSTLSAINTNRWTIKAKNIIQLDIVPENIGRHYPISVGLVGDAKKSLAAVSAVLKEAGYKGSLEFRDDIFRRRAEWEKQVFSGPIADKGATPVPPVALVAELEKLLKENSVLTIDAGNPGAWTHLMKLPENITYMKPVNFGNMGFAIPAAIGAKAASPEKEVIALLGDGSLGMTLAELETMAREKLPIIVLVVNDDAYGNIRQEELFKVGKPRYIGVDFTSIDYVNVAKALGCDGAIVRTAQELPEAFRKARQSDCPYMIEVKLDGSFTVWPEAF
ncbi:MAG TPA: thiamine pyrophosphate-binding protein [Anaerovoracaceae bacterium]|nr:thiamine pyrophosphate-binding protein [Anaerovoracaceae bacterium]